MNTDSLERSTPAHLCPLLPEDRSLSLLKNSSGDARSSITYIHALPVSCTCVICSCVQYILQLWGFLEEAGTARVRLDQNSRMPILLAAALQF